MIFTFGAWQRFCERLKCEPITCRTAREVLHDGGGHYLILKHDVETAVDRAYQMAQIEHNCGLRATYYVQAYLLENEKNVHLLQEMQVMGHEITYHYDVLDAAKGDFVEAQRIFEQNRKRFTECGFAIETLCQHGNPIVERIGYSSNRDFFRSPETQRRYPQLADIMVDFAEKAKTEFLYFSDAGRSVKLIKDPMHNDLTPGVQDDVCVKNLNGVLPYLKENNCIVSTHPHRYTTSAMSFVVKTALFRVIRTAARLLAKIPLFQRFMSRYYYLAKKL